MQTLWAPWRMQYIEAEAREPEGCLFCSRIEADNDPQNLIVYRGPGAVVFLNKFPYNNGHALVMPTRHVGELDELTGPELLEVMETVRLCRRGLELVMKPHGYNIGVNLGLVAGAGVPGHFHVHVVPRWEGDTNFMPVLADTKVMPEHLLATREKLARALTQLAGADPGPAGRGE